MTGLLETEDVIITILQSVGSTDQPTSHKTWIFTHTTVRTSHLTLL